MPESNSYKLVWWNDDTKTWVGEYQGEPTDEESMNEAKSFTSKEEAEEWMRNSSAYNKEYEEDPLWYLHEVFTRVSRFC